MNYREYIDYFSGLLEADAIKVPNIAKHVELAIQAGLDEFWGANNWYFKAEECEFAITDIGEESYELPDRFDGVGTVRERASGTGLRLRYFPREEFFRLVPDATAYGTSNVQAFTVYREADDDNKLMIAFFPRPSSAQTFYITGYRKPPAKESVALVPERFQGGLLAFIAKHVYPFGHKGRLTASALAAQELKRLETQNKLDLSDYVRFGDSSDEPTHKKYDFTN